MFKTFLIWQPMRSSGQLTVTSEYGGFLSRKGRLISKKEVEEKGEKVILTIPPGKWGGRYLNH